MNPTAEAKLNIFAVPYGDFNCLIMPPDVEEKQNDYGVILVPVPAGPESLEQKSARL
jgi:glutathione-independent formaldehyde dehydrogenase